jgi:hypothetical protein
MLVRHVHSSAEAAGDIVRSCLQVSYRAQSICPLQPDSTNAPMHNGCLVIKLDAYDSARTCISVCLRFDIGDNAYAPGAKKKAQNRFRARKRWSWHSSFGKNETTPNFASGINHLRGRTNETARDAGVSDVRNGNQLPPCAHAN